MIEEIRLRKDYLSERKIKTIYFGGGTPSLLSSEQLESIISALHQYFDLSNVEETTLEANPEDIDSDRLSSYKSFGINRLSLGFQSLDDSVLNKLNRVHNAKQCLEAFELSRAYGFDKISVDLIYGIPGRTHESWIRDLDSVCQLSPEHISSYALTIEEKTALSALIQSGKFARPEEDFTAEQFEILCERLGHNGYEQYEISNFCRDNHIAAHNSNYWLGKHYLGIGPGAHSYDGQSRSWMIDNNSKYVEQMKMGKLPLTNELLSVQDQYNDYLLTSIRTKWGTNLSLLTEYGISLNKATLDHLKENRLIKIIDNHIILSKKGKLLADEITAQLMSVDLSDE